MFAKYYFVLPLIHNILHHFFTWAFFHLTCLPILEGYILPIENYDYDKYFSTAAWGKSGGTCDAKVKGKYQKTTKENDIA